jgi:uncharacterized protein (TIGR02646 family)
LRRIVKRPEPAALRDWKESWSQSGGVGHLGWADLQNPEKSLIHTALMLEQGHVCCYCERRISKETSHIEHFRPQGDQFFPQLRFDYSNLHASCTTTTDRDPPARALTCGDAKGDMFDETDLISPVESGCANHFRYLANGEIRPAGGEGARNRAEFTIDVLKLATPRLESARRAAFDATRDFIENGGNDEQVRARCAGPDGNEEIEEFASALLYYLDAIY